MKDVRIGRAYYRGGRRDPVLEVRDLDDGWDARYLDDTDVAVVPLDIWERIREVCADDL